MATLVYIVSLRLLLSESFLISKDPTSAGAREVSRGLEISKKVVFLSNRCKYLISVERRTLLVSSTRETHGSTGWTEKESLQQEDASAGLQVAAGTVVCRCISGSQLSSLLPPPFSHLSTHENASSSADT